MQYRLRASQYEWRFFWDTHKDTVLSWLLIFLAVYFLLYLMLRDPVVSIIPSSVVIGALLGCLFTALCLQLRRSQAKERPQVFYRPEQRFSQMFSEARREHLQNNLRRDFDTKVEPGMTPQFTRLSPYTATPVPPLTTVLRTSEEAYNRRSRFDYKPTEPTITPLSLQTFREETKRPAIGIERKWEKPLESPEKHMLYQGDLLDYETQSSNTLAMELYEKMGIKRRVPIWAENVRSWMANTFIPMILTKHYQNLEQLNKTLGYYNRRLVFYRTEEYPVPGAIRPILWDDLYESVMTNSMGLTISFSLQPMDQFRYTPMNEGQIKITLKELVLDRATIEKYLRLQDSNPSKREYVIERLKQLQANFVGEYKNNGGMDWHGEPWNPSLPKDSDVFSFVIKKTFLLDRIMAVL